MGMKKRAPHPERKTIERDMREKARLHMDMVKEKALRDYEEILLKAGLTPSEYLGPVEKSAASPTA